MSLLDDVDALYEGCVMDPCRWTDQAFVDWTESVAASSTVDRQIATRLRRCLNAGRKLAAFWAAAETGSAPTEWRSRVDVALGVRAWRPQLELAQAMLESAPTEETFDRVAALFPVVTNQPFLDGIDYATWRDRR